jgi:hypothetical protein
MFSTLGRNMALELLATIAEDGAPRTRLSRQGKDPKLGTPCPVRPPSWGLRAGVKSNVSFRRPLRTALLNASAKRSVHRATVKFTE